MIAHRFRPVIWVAGCAFAATALYTVSLSVASERTRLEDLDRQIASTQRDIRQLQTELGTRASLRQLERWNVEALALSAPSASQFRATETALRNIDGNAVPGNNFAPPPVMVAAATRTDTGVAPAQTAAVAPAVTPAKPVAVTVASADTAVRKAPAAKPAAATKTAAADKRPAAKTQKFAMLDRTLVDQGTFSEILVRAENESQAAGGKGNQGQ
jgi:hypothetical protein